MNKKYNIRADNDENFYKECEKASQFVYGVAYNSLQERPGNGLPSKHYLRKKYIKNKKFIGLPMQEKKIQHTKNYRNELKQIIIDERPSHKKKYGDKINFMQYSKRINEITNQKKDFRKSIKRVLDIEGLIE